MDAERWRRVEELFEGALEHEGSKRIAFLDGACPDPELRREVQALLDQSNEGLLDRPAAALIAGASVGPYRILELIGAGGMGTVYKALDTRLDRTVAIKFSGSRFSERFEREARAIAALNHPHICTLHDVGPNYLVMEHVEGKPLRGPVAAEQALALAAQLLDALDAAHRKGIVHRDLKPDNILVTRSGVKVLDFGLAKVPAPLAAGKDTVTQRGAIVGTLRYMSPEQVQGKETDARSDIFSFGVVLYELLTGRRAFDSDTSAGLIAAILEREPPLIGDFGMPGLEPVVRRCLAKDPAERWQSVRDLKVVIESLAAAQTAAPSRLRKWRIAWPLAATLAVAAILLALAGRPGPPAEASRFSFIPPGGNAIDGASAYVLQPMEVSPDGRHLAFVAGFEGKRWLWVRPLSSEVPERLAHTEGATMPFWSPDSQQIGYFAPTPPELENRQLPPGWGTMQLKKIPAAGGAPQLICPSPTADGGTWNQDGTILFAAGNSPIYRVPASGGEPKAVTQLNAAQGETSHSMPEFLPDGRHFLFWATTGTPKSAPSGWGPWTSRNGTWCSSTTPCPGLRRRTACCSAATGVSTRSDST